jgi:hypothetical protein
VHLQYDDRRLAEAFDAVFAAEGPPDELTRTLTAADGLGTAIAVELATQIAPELGVSDGATAALCGLLVGARLADAGEQIPEALPAAVETVRVLGRSRVIASHCDLAAVAILERAVARGFGVAAGELRERLLQLFELGFAIGLAARYS